MSGIADPSIPSEPFNRLYDACRARGMRVGLRVSDDLIRHPSGDRRMDRRDLVAIEIPIPERHRVLVELIDHSGLQAAAHSLLSRLPTPGAPT